MKNHDFSQQSEKNGLLHPPNCACVRCAAGRESQELDDSLRERVKEMLDNAFLEMVKGNFMGGCATLGQGTAIGLVRSGFLGNMANIMQMREIAAAYFATEKPE
jgi:tRNA A37 N6-isopentenylltransferase MiaA